jgi:hypothetical protein
VKGGSESGAIGAPAAVGNAVIDALWELGIRDISLPITSETIWRALAAARQAGAGSARGKVVPCASFQPIDQADDKTDVPGPSTLTK